jgi:hypothetical protein
MNEWAELLWECEAVAVGRDSIRLANLCIAVFAGQQRQLLPHSRDEHWLAEAVGQLAVEPLPWNPTDVVSRRLVEAAHAAAGRLGRLSAMDEWIQVFQSSDPARKSRGAYATPQTLARPMAHALLRSTKPLRIVDPSSGAGGLLVAVLTELKRRGGTPADTRAHVARLHGVELDPVARELSCLIVWLHAGVVELSPRSVAERIVRGNAITREWALGEPFDALIMNPPWDSLRHAGAASAHEDLERDETMARLLTQQPGAETLPPLYSAQGRGDRNLYKAFVELAPHLLTDGGRLVALVPGAWSSDLGTAPLRRMYFRHLAVEQWTSFENRRGYFPIDGRYKFGVLVASRTTRGTVAFKTRGFAADAGDLDSPHVSVRAEDLETLGGRASMLPDLVSYTERDTMLKYLTNGYPLFESGPLGVVSYERELDMTLDRKTGAFIHVQDAGATPVGDGTWTDEAGDVFVPLVEGRMVAHYEFHAKSWRCGSGRTAQWSWANGERLRDCQPQFLARSRVPRSTRIAICDVTSATNTRTVLATWVPSTWPCGNTAPVLVFESERLALAALAVVNSMVFDWLARRVVSGLHLNRFYLDTLTWPELRGEQVDQLAAAAADIVSMSPRYSDLNDKLSTTGSGSEYVDAHVRIERLVASGYGLSRQDLAAVFSPDPADRRGFWRAFASDPHSTAIAQGSLAGLSAAARRKRVLAHRA